MEFFVGRYSKDEAIFMLQLFLGVITIYFLYKISSFFIQRNRTFEKVNKKVLLSQLIQDNLENKLEKVRDLPKWKAILDLSFEDLSNQLQTGELSSIDTLHAFQWKAIQVNKKQNCVVEFIEDAEDEARKCDKLLLTDRQPLHGLPVSIKECFHVNGRDATAGLTQYLFKPNTKDGITVHLLRKNGAIPFCLTNVPQTMMGYQCSNPCFGASGNPYDPSREVGGSSGGEGSLIGGGGSVLGIGSDIGGSLRCPAALCGIASLRPTKGRDISLVGCNAGNISQVEPATFPAVAGFMSSSVSGLTTAFNTMWNDDRLARLDKDMIPMQWKDSIFSSKRKLRIGYCTSDGHYGPHPGCKRAVLETVTLLAKLGHETTEFETPNMNEVFRLSYGKIFADNLKDLNETLTYTNLIDSSMSGMATFHFILNWIPTWVVSYVLNPIMSLFTKERLYPAFDTGAKLFHGTTQKDKLVQDYLEKMNESNVDLLLFPASLIPAPKKDYYFFGKVLAVMSAWITWNLFDFPAGVLPVTKVTQEDENNLNTTFPTNDLVYRHIKDGCKNSIGMPLGVQVVGRRFNEELVLRLMKKIESVAEFNRI